MGSWLQRGTLMLLCFYAPFLKSQSNQLPGGTGPAQTLDFDWAIRHAVIRSRLCVSMLRLRLCCRVPVYESAGPNRTHRLGLRAARTRRRLADVGRGGSHRPCWSGLRPFRLVLKKATALRQTSRPYADFRSAWPLLHSCPGFVPIRTVRKGGVGARTADHAARCSTPMFRSPFMGARSSAATALPRPPIRATSAKVGHVRQFIESNCGFRPGMRLRQCRHCRRPSAAKKSPEGAIRGW